MKKLIQTNIFRHEFIKIIMSPALIGFTVLCLAFNMLFVLTDRYHYANFVAEASFKTGYRLGDDFNERANNLEDSEYARWLREEASEMTDVFDGYTTGYIAENYIRSYGLTGLTADLMIDKYERLQSVADARFEAGDGMTLYLAEATFWTHQKLFSVVMGALLFEGILIAALIMLLSLGYEFGAKTDLVVYSTKTGRRVNRVKFAASIIAGLAAYALVTAVTLAVYIGFNPFGGTWGSSVSSGFNYIREVMGIRPFITWHSFTIYTYLFACLGISIGVVICFALMTYAIGLWVRNSYIAFLVFALLNFALFGLPGMIFGMTMPTFIIALSPIWLSLQQGMWFTDGASNVLWAHFETLGVIASAILLAVLCLWSSAQFKRRSLL
ncbi:MAG: hypothetical protein LBD23_18340 [Oscillospiraceae bacterium]|jgi:hypothetical protein|nr:hypothetical protein [Oscillospiraceae bacterium]